MEVPFVLATISNGNPLNCCCPDFEMIVGIVNVFLARCIVVTKCINHNGHCPQGFAVLRSKMYFHFSLLLLVHLDV